MKTKHAFFSENLLVSIAGHLGIIAIMITSFAVLNPMDKIVMSDHVQIYEIDLSRVEIKGNETLVFNTEAPEAKIDEPQPKKEDKKPNFIEPLGDEPTLKKITALPDVIKKTDTKPTPNAPKSSTIVRVNRETTSLNRTMTVSVADALRVAMTRCWVINQNRSDVADLRVVAHLTMSQNGMVRDVWFEGAARSDSDPAFAYVVETIRNAVNACQPFKMLPASEFSEWENIQFTFYPATHQIQ